MTARLFVGIPAGSIIDEEEYERPREVVIKNGKEYFLVDENDEPVYDDDDGLNADDGDTIFNINDDKYAELDDIDKIFRHEGISLVYEDSSCVSEGDVIGVLIDESDYGYLEDITLDEIGKAMQIVVKAFDKLGIKETPKILLTADS